PYEVITEEGLLVFGQIEGDKKELDKFYKNLLFNLRIQNKFISYDEKNIKIPFYISIKGQVLSILEKYQLKGFIVETTPFRLSKYQQITEKTPIELFKEEYGFNGN
ncbi:MAG: hypothetical protein KAW03_07210, partial [Candidatus Lokiarchaeota archaeon]|nr:hypothetical protein [Candidatus Lokiarchaeota archaeon]